MNPGIAGCYMLSLRRSMAIRPMTPEPNSARLPGSKENREDNKVNTDKHLGIGASDSRGEPLPLTR